MKPALSTLLSAYTASHVPIERTGKHTAVFAAPMRLYRVLDRFERDVLADALAEDPDARFTGGTYNIPTERAGGAAFAGSREEALRFGQTHAKRLHAPLYIVEVEGEGLPFTHLDLDWATDDGLFRREACCVGYGCSLRPRVRDVRAAWAVGKNLTTLTPIDWLALLRDHRTGTAAAAVRAVQVFDDTYDVLAEVVRTRPRTVTSGQERLVREFHAAARVVREVLPGHPGLQTLRMNILDRAPAKVRTLWASLEREARASARGV